MGSCAVKGSNNLIEQQQTTDVNQVVRLLINSSYGGKNIGIMDYI